MPPDWGFELLYESHGCLVVSKPGGLLTQAPQGIDSLERRVRAALAQRRLAAGDRPDESSALATSAPPQASRPETGAGEPVRPAKPLDADPQSLYLGIPHRLDRPVSGALVLATTRRAARRLAEQFEDRLVAKIYWALVEGHVEPAAGRWEDWVRKVPDEPRAERVEPHEAGAQRAELVYQVLERLDDGCLLEIGLLTGRMHQIRLQAALRGHPVWGDAMYGAQRTFGPPCDDPRQRWIALHAQLIAFRHPTTRDSLRIEAPLPDCWPALGPATGSRG